MRVKAWQPTAQVAKFSYLCTQMAKLKLYRSKSWQHIRSNNVAYACDFYHQF